MRIIVQLFFKEEVVMPESHEPPTKVEAVKKWIIGLTSVLVVIPSLVNAGVDIYSSFAKLPKTESEQINVDLFKKYFNKQPLTTFPVPIKTNIGTVEVRFAIYDEGDVYVEFGNLTQWFPFPDDHSRKQASLSVFPQAIAQTIAPFRTGTLRGVGNYQQSERFDGHTLVRERAFQNGVTEQYRLDPRTGAILQFTARRTSNSGTNIVPPPDVFRLAPIDLDAIRANRASQAKK